MRKAVTKTVIFAMTIAMLTGCGQRENSNRESKSDTSSTKTSENVQEVNFNLVGEIADAEGKLSGAGEILKWENGEQITLSDYQGNEIDVKFTKNEESAMLDLVDDSTSVLGESILSVRKERGINKCALYTESGEQLIPFEADLFKAMNGYTATRFIQVGYITNETTDNKKALFAETEKNSLQYYIEGDDNAKGYEGYFHIYDLKEKKMIDLSDITTQEELDSYEVCGDKIIHTENGKVMLYDGQGVNEITSGNGQVREIGKGIFVVDNDDTGEAIAYNTAGDEIFKTTKNLTCNGEHILCYEDDDTVSILNKEGKEVVPKGTYKSDCFVFDNEYFLSLKKEDTNVLLDTQGNVIMETANDINQMSIGLCTVENGDNYDIYDNKGKVTSIKKASNNVLPNQALYEEKEDGSKQYYVYDQNSLSLNIKESEGDGVFVTCSESNSNGEETFYGLYEVISGKQLLEAKYEEIMIGSKYVYAYDGAKWNIYEYQIPDKFAN